MPLFGQILAALYQEDIVEEDDIRGWHILPTTSGEGRKEGIETENFKKCQMIGTHMIQQFDDQESESEGEKPTSVTAPASIVASTLLAAVVANVSDDSDSDEDDSDETSSVGAGVPEGGEVSEDADVSASEESNTATSTNASEDEDEGEEANN